MAGHVVDGNFRRLLASLAVVLDLKPVCILPGIMVLRLWTYVCFTEVGWGSASRSGSSSNASGDEAIDGVFVVTTHLLAEKL